MASRQFGVEAAAAPVNAERRFLLKHVGFDKRIVRAAGHYLFDDAGTAYLDALAQYGALPFGHNPPVLWERLSRSRSSSEPNFLQPLCGLQSDELAEKLLAVLPRDMRHVTYVNSGAEATEAAIKLVRAATGRSLILSFEGGFHGKTTGALMCTGNLAYRAPFLLDHRGFGLLPFGDLERCRATLRTGEVAAVFVESIQGEGGMRLQPQGFLAALSALCREHGTLLVIDEVQSGLGRCGTMFAFEQQGDVRPDVVLLAKALGGGMLPLGAVVSNAAAWSPAFGALHSSTFANGNLACGIGCAVLEELQRDDQRAVQHAAAMGERLGAGLRALALKYPDQLEATQGQGLMRGIRLQPWTDDDSYFTAHASQLGFAVPILAGHLLNEHGVLTAPVFNHSNVLRIQPSLTIEAAEIDRVLGALDAATGLLAECRYAELIGYMAKTKPVRNTAPRPLRTAAASPRVPTQTGASSRRRGSFAFFIHPTDEQVLFDTLPSELDRLDASGHQAWHAWMRSWFSKMHEPAVVNHQPQIASLQGGHVEGWLIACPLTPAQMMRLPRPEKEVLLRQYMAVARELAVDIVGLGAFTSVISRAGTDLADCGLNLTTGNSLTALASAGTLCRAAQHFGLDATSTRAAVIGAAGSVGRLAAIALAEHFGALDLLGNAQSAGAVASLQEVAGEIYGRAIRLGSPGTRSGVALALCDKLAQRLRTLADEAEKVPVAQRLFLNRLLFQQIDEAMGAAAPLRVSTDVKAALAGADVVLSATSASRSFIEAQWLRSGAIVCDVARPLDMLDRVQDQRSDVWVYEGGVMKLPGDISFGRQNVLGYPRGRNLACLSETITLAMEGATRHYSLGTRPDFAEAGEILRAARSHGFEPYLELPGSARATASPRLPAADSTLAFGTA